MTPLVASCHCGQVRLAIARAPETLTECNCSICRRYGVLWAYYSPGEVQVLAAPEATDVYAWDDRSIEFHRCKHCGCVTHWAPVDGARDRLGINARLLDLDVVQATRVRKLDGAVTERYVDEADGDLVE